MLQHMIPIYRELLAYRLTPILERPERCPPDPSLRAFHEVYPLSASDFTEDDRVNIAKFWKHLESHLIGSCIGMKKVVRIEADTFIQGILKLRDQDNTEESLLWHLIDVLLEVAVSHDILAKRERDQVNYGQVPYLQPLLPYRHLREVLIGNKWPTKAFLKIPFKQLMAVDLQTGLLQHEILTKAIYRKYHRFYPDWSLKELWYGWSVDERKVGTDLLRLPFFRPEEIRVLRKHVKHDQQRLSWRMADHPRLGQDSTVQRALRSPLGERQVIFRMVEEFADIQRLPRDQVQRKKQQKRTHHQMQ